MRRQTKKLALTMLLSVAMISANLQLVSAQEETLTEANQAAEDHSSEEAAPSQDAGEVKDNSEANQENTAPAENNTPAENTAPAENSAPTESTPPAENTTPVDTETGKTEGAAGTETQAPVTDTNASGETTEGSGEGQEGNTEQDAQNPDGATGENGEAAADSTEGAQPEQSFVNKNGEEVKPSELVGVDYNTIAGNYDGEANAVKQYMISDEVPAGTIMDSYVDESGNLVMVISQGVAGAAQEEEKPEEDKTVLEEVVDAVEYGLESAFGSSSSAPAVDGSFTGWDDIPISYEQNHDDSGNCWVNGFWIKDPETGETKQHILEQGTYDNIARHEMQLYCDGNNVYLKIKYAGIYGGIWAFDEAGNANAAHGNGEDFQFYIDGVDTKFQITQQANGQPITNWTPEAGTYVVDVRNGNYDPSFSIVDGAVAYYHVTENGVNNSLELKIPMEAFKTQNGAVNLDNFNMVQFFTPNLMQDRLSAAGSSTGAEPFAAAAFLLVPTSCMLIKKKNEKEGFGIA